MSGDIMNDEKNGMYLQEFENLRSEIVSLKKDINRALERSNNRHMDALFMEIKGDISRPVLHYMLDDTKESFDRGFCAECNKNEICKPAFSNILQDMALLLLEDKVSDKALSQFRERFDELKSFAVTDDCNGCVTTASQVFEKQMGLIRSLTQNPNEKLDIDYNININEISDDIVAEICEPLANRQRLLILRSLNSDGLSFSQLSKITGLRGGNLLFHIQKLLDTGMILQRTERGDYMITRKGHMTLKGMAELYEKLSNC